MLIKIFIETMKLISYNVNGIRAAMGKDFLTWLKDANPDVLCIQESKAQPERIDEQGFKDLGYKCFWYSAEKKGYSGVGILSKQQPKHVEYGIGIDYMDTEGRIIRTDFENFSAISVYVPSATNIDRLDLKMQFCYDFLDYIKALKKEIPNLIISGDFNICHQAIDIHDPIKLAKVSGFLPMEREWLSKFIEECSLIDSFRHFNHAPHQYSWWSYRANARANNKGWRLDYNFVSQNMEVQMKRAVILKEAIHSDHCPVMVELDDALLG